MEISTRSVYINRYLPIVILYFFFNSFLLPVGLLYTTILTPLFIVWLYRYPSFNYLWWFFIISLPFVIVHFINGVDVLVYIKSYLLLFSVYVFCLAFFQFLRVCTSLGGVFKNLLLLNSFFVLLAVLIFFIPPLRDIVWYKNALTSGVNNVYRLKMFTYESSYYSSILVPVALYYYLKIFMTPFPNKGLVFLMVTLPILLALSFGVIIGIALTIFLIFCSDIRLLSRNRRLPTYILICIILLLGVLFLLIQFFPDNVIFIRIENIFKGRDTSFSGRTFDSIYLGWKLAAQKSLLFGCGPGQIKVIGLQIFSQFYLHTFDPTQLAIPNNIGDILAQFGLIGVFIKLFLEFYMFFKTKVYTNFYRLALFLFIFIYQFTGSFITNIAEYVIWLLAFCPFIFPEFDKRNILSGEIKSPSPVPVI